MFHTENEWLDVISISENYVPKTRYVKFENTIEKLCEFIRIFKADLQNIEIDKKENHEYYVCDLIMVYDSYKIHAEFESTGIKKLIRLFAFIREMVNGGIVIIMILIQKLVIFWRMRKNIVRKMDMSLFGFVKILSRCI